MNRPQTPVHRTILVVDVQGFGDRRRTNLHQIAIRDGMYQALEQAFQAAGIPWDHRRREDRGDGVFYLAPPGLPKSGFAEALPEALAEALRAHNDAHGPEEQIRLRMALHAGEVSYDDHGVTGKAINLAFRLVDANPLKDALAYSPGVLALIVSAWFYDEVIQNSPGSKAATYRQVRVEVKETRELGWICLPDHPYPPCEVRVPSPDPLIPEPRQLPAGVRHFSGRATELQMLTTLMRETPDGGGKVVIVAISGTPGVGKTTLAVHWAHQVAPWYPDGQLYVNLHGFDQDGRVKDPSEAIREFLDALQVQPHQIPNGLDARAGLYRSLLAGRRMLIVLDNALDSAQVRPLLPATPGCLALITSRNKLTSLAVDGAHSISLDVFTDDEARDLLARRLGDSRVAAEPEAAQDIITQCAWLPLALALVAARAADPPTFPLSAIAADLRESRGLPLASTGAEPTADLRAVFSWSYKAVSPAAMRLFRLLGLTAGPDISVAAAVSLVGISAARLRPLLDELTRANLIAERTPGRYSFHDLLRAYAAEQAKRTDRPGQRHAAVHRLVDHYLHTAHTAARLLDPAFEPIALTEPQPGVSVEILPDYESALAWLTTEHPVLLAAVDLAAVTELHACTWQLACSLRTFLFLRAHWHDQVAVNHAALTAARRLADLRAQALVHSGLADAHAELGRFDDARTHHGQALDLSVQSGDQAMEARAHLALSYVWQLQDQLALALEHSQEGLDLYVSIGHRQGQAIALSQIGWAHALIGDYQDALICSQQALTLLQELGDLYAQAVTWDTLGYANHQLGRYDESVICYQQALELYRHLRTPYAEACTLDHLGDAHHKAGHLSDAHDTWQVAFIILSDLGHPKAGEVGAKLAVPAPPINSDPAPDVLSTRGAGSVPATASQMSAHYTPAKVPAS
jgi:tetratricopeptide (TPR) repeat protein